jgi:hypothetical protein
MIKNIMGEMMEFDLVKANKLNDYLKRWIEDGNLLPYEVSELVFSVWGYGAALEEIKYLRKELEGIEIKQVISNIDKSLARSDEANRKFIQDKSKRDERIKSLKRLLR